jgi:hypothetical protein
MVQTSLSEQEMLLAGIPKSGGSFGENEKFATAIANILIDCKYFSLYPAPQKACTDAGDSMHFPGVFQFGSFAIPALVIEPVETQCR